MHIHQTIPVTIVDPVTSTPSPAVKHMEDRTFYAYRNMGFALTHYHPYLRGEKSHPIVIENMNQLRLYHSKNFIYHVLLRRAYNIKTFQTFIGIISDKNEPFYNLNELVDTRSFAYHHTASDQNIIKSYCQQLGSPFAPPTHLRFDCIAVNSHASAFITSCDKLSDDFILNFIRTAHYSYYLHQHTSNERYITAWKSLYGPPKTKTERPVLLYIGVGPQEFPEGVINEMTRQSLRSLVTRAMHRVEPPPPITHMNINNIKTTENNNNNNNIGLSPELFPSSSLEIAKKYGVRLLQRWQMRYFMLRY